MAAIAPRRLNLTRLGFLDDFGIIAKEFCVQMALQASADLNATPRSDMKVENSGRESEIERLGATLMFIYAGIAPNPQQLLDCKRAGRLIKDAKFHRGAKEILLTQM